MGKPSGGIIQVNNPTMPRVRAAVPIRPPYTFFHDSEGGFIIAQAKDYARLHLSLSY